MCYFLKLKAARLEQLTAGFGYSLPEAKSLLRATAVAFSLESDIAVVSAKVFLFWCLPFPQKFVQRSIHL